MFAGSSHQNYMTYLLEVYCLLRYEASEDLRDGILDNWLVNVTGELGKWIEGDLLQEHYNRWLEDMVKKCGGDFDDKFYRSTLAPNVDHFLRIKEEIENAFELANRGKTHTSPHLRDELRVLLALYKEENLHLFCAGRTLGHAALNQLDQGYDRLQKGKLDNFISKTTAYADVIADIQACKQAEDMVIPHFEEQADEFSNDINLRIDLNSSESEISKSGSSDSSSSSSFPQSESQDHDQDNLDHSNNHLVSGSDFDVYISEDGLTHRVWYENELENSTDEEEGAQDFDQGLFSEGESGEDNYQYNSD